MTSPFNLRQIALRLNGRRGWIKSDLQRNKSKKISNFRDLIISKPINTTDIGGSGHMTEKITKYEYAKIAGLRAEQLQNGYTPLFEEGNTHGMG